MVIETRNRRRQLDSIERRRQQLKNLNNQEEDSTDNEYSDDENLHKNIKIVYKCPNLKIDEFKCKPNEKYKQTIYRKKFTKFDNKLETKSNNWFFKLTSFLMVLICIFLAKYFIFNKKPNYNYLNTLQNYKSSLNEFSFKIIQHAINNTLIKKYTKPSVVLIYTESNNKDKLKNFYFEIENDVLLFYSKTNISKNIFDISNINNDYEKIIQKLNKNKIVFLDNLQDIIYKDYTKLFGFMDEDFSLVKECIIFISIYSEEKILSKSLLSKEMDLIVRKYMRRLWFKMDVSNREAFISRLTQSVVFFS